MVRVARGDEFRGAKLGAEIETPKASSRGRSLERGYPRSSDDYAIWGAS